MAIVAQRRHIVAVRVLKHTIRIDSFLSIGRHRYPSLSQGERRVAERLRADFGTDPHVDGVDTDPCIDSDGNCGVDLSGTINGKRDVGVQVGCEHFSKHLNLDSTARGVHEARTCCRTKTVVVIIKLALTCW